MCFEFNFNLWILSHIVCTFNYQYLSLLVYVHVHKDSLTYLKDMYGYKYRVVMYILHPVICP